MQDIRKVLCWSFAFTCLLHIFVSIRYFLHIIDQHYAFPYLRSLIVAAFFSFIVATISGIAWWTVWKARSSARGWAIAASLANVLVFLRATILQSEIAWGHLGALVIGIIGLAAFSWRYEQPFPARTPMGSADHQSDG